MKLIFQDSFPKEEGQEGANEDFASLGEDSNYFALSDGATDSFDSQYWARCLVNSFVNEKKVPSEEWLSSNIKKFYAKYSSQFSTMPWYQLERFQRGSFATFLGIRVNETETDKTLNIYLIGDSYLFLFMKDNSGQYRYINKIFPIPNFRGRPLLLSSKAELNSSIDFKSKEYFKEFCFSKNCEIIAICTSDALADWIISNYKDINKVYDKFSDINQDSFRELITIYRQDKSMKTDDTTITILKI